MSDDHNFDLSSLGWGVIPVGAVLGAMLGIGAAIHAEKLDDVRMLAAMTAGFAVVGASAGCLLVTWTKIRSKWIAVPVIIVEAVILLLMVIVVIGRLAEGR